MPKTVPKSSPSGTPNAKRRRRELESNSGDDSEESSRKRPNRSEPDQRIVEPLVNNPNNGAAANPPPSVSPDNANRNESHFLLEALRRIQELQDEIDFLENDPYAEDADSSEGDDELSFDQDFAQAESATVVVGQQAEAFGFAVCARETMAFLEREGVAMDSPLMVNLRNRLIGRCESNVSC
ncbi:uncharacterized protein LOC128739514 [Sabethes cyaneus]|uniref:uncharacterized protein LOC128739514 n=1 Tax=Sabethes cyaneus TaxID=53552 RepID=UPI00237DA58D|nr:uncharacterized protein LOC128739514 [Sabethes cyaneus]